MFIAPWRNFYSENVFRFTLDSFRNNTQHEQQHKEHWWWFCCSHNDACGLLILHYQSHVVRWFHLTGSNKFERFPPRVHFLPFLLYLSSYFEFLDLSTIFCQYVFYINVQGRYTEIGLRGKHHHLYFLAFMSLIFLV